MGSLLQHTDWLNGRVPDEVRAQLRQLVEVVGYLPYRQPLGVLTADAVLLAGNRPFLDLLGASGEEVLDADWEDYMPGWGERVASAITAPGETPRTLAFEEYVLTAAGEPVWVSVVASPVLAPWLPGDASDPGDHGPGRRGPGDGGPVGDPGSAIAAWALFVVDATPQSERTDDASRREILDLLLESPGEFVVRLDGDGRIRFVSASLLRLLGMTTAEIEGKDLAAAHHMAPEEYEREAEGLLAELMSPPFSATREMALATPGGERVVQWVFESLLADGGELRGVLGVGRDVTKRRFAEAALRRRLDLEVTVSSISTRFVSATRDTAAAVVDYALAEVGGHIGADRIGLFELASDGVTTSRARVWRRETDRVTEDDAPVDFADLSWLRDRLEEGASGVIDSVQDLPPEATAERAAFERAGLGAVMAVPIAQDKTLAGCLMLGVDARGDEAAADGLGWDDDDLYLLHLVADQLAGLLIWLADDENLRTVSDAFLAFGPDVDDNITKVCRAAAAVTAADFVLYTRRRGDDLIAEVGWNIPDDLPKLTPADGRRACADVMARADDHVHVIRDFDHSAYAHEGPFVGRYGLRTFIGFPIVVGGRAVASLSCLFTTDVSLRESQLELLRVLGRAAAVEEERRVAIEERLLGVAQLEQAMERTVGTLSGAMSTRDPYTAGHARRVAQLAAAIGSELGMAGADLRMLRLAATVHDIGKIAVPSEILSKPARLSEAEYAIIQCHCEKGHELLEPAGLPGEVTDAVLQHHERLDGSGYPAGLTGDEIGRFARIIAVADVVEAMASHRPYRPAVGLEPALAEIEEGRGVRYDDRVADACVRLFRDKGFAFAD